MGVFGDISRMSVLIGPKPSVDNFVDMWITFLWISLFPVDNYWG